MVVKLVFSPPATTEITEIKPEVRNIKKNTYGVN
jgi:hypothetical protein